MEDVTDAAFRRVFVKYSKPDVMFTEFTSADGLVLAAEEGKQRLLKKLIYAEAERPIVAQLFSAVPERLEAAARMVAELGFDGVDINMGCPVDAVTDIGCGAALIKNPALARELIRAAKKSGLPVSVKTRIGYKQDELDTWLPELLAESPAAITIHARTQKEMSKVPAHWDTIGRAVQIRNDSVRGDASHRTLIIGNGDVVDLADAKKKAEETGCDGVMLGRALYGNPWLFNDGLTKSVITREDKVGALVEHIRLFDELLGTASNFATLKKHFKAYISGWDGAKALRERLMHTNGPAEAIAILQRGE